MMTSAPSAKRPTIADVALLAGVSKGAVSRALNGGQGISEPTIARIRAAALELRWSPNSAARAISGGPARAIGLVLRRPADLLENDPFFPGFLAGVETVLSKIGYSAVVRFVSDGTIEQEAYSELAGERRVDGFLLTDLRQRDPRYGWLEAAGIPAVVAGTPPEDCPFPSVGTGSADEVRALIAHLIEEGHTNIAHVSGPRNLRHARRRAQLWSECLTAAGLKPGQLIDGAFSASGSVRATRQLLDAADRPTAIFYSNDIMAIAGMSVIAEHGLDVPNDIAVAGFDGISLASYVVPSLTTVRCDYRRMGSIATQMLLAQVRGEDVPHVAAGIGAELRIRRSSTRSTTRANAPGILPLAVTA